jgi:catechol 2,3-dioxygenase-like lactoylglutathione lyase family enzyme
MTRREPVPARSIAGFGLTTPDASRLATFYAAAFGCQFGPRERLQGAPFERLMGVRGGAWRQRLTVSEQSIELLQFDDPGAPYPPTSSPIERVFQHLALVVADIHRALERLAATAGWTPISMFGPQRLPASSGGVTAYKFRDPDGHPLEFLEFPAADTPARWQHRGQSTEVLGIDHSAMSVADTATSLAFYRSHGFAPTTHSLNQGSEQASLDGIPNPHVDVTALAARRPDPHLELLCYQGNAPRGSGAAAANDVAATRIIMVIDATAAATEEFMIHDPDGHRLQFVSDAWLHRSDT